MSTTVPSPFGRIAVFERFQCRTCKVCFTGDTVKGSLTEIEALLPDMAAVVRIHRCGSGFHDCTGVADFVGFTAPVSTE